MYRANPAFFNGSERTFLNVRKQVYLKPVLSDSFRLLLGPVAENLISEVTVSREIKQQRRRLLRKRDEKVNSRYFKVYPVQSVICWQIVARLNSKRLYQSLGKEKESRWLVFTSLTKREIRHFHVVRAMTAKKCTKSVLHVQSCCFAFLPL